MQFPIQFICATHDFADYGHIVPAPYLRRSFTLDSAPEQAEVLVSGLGLPDLPGYGDFLRRL